MAEKRSRPSHPDHGPHKKQKSHHFPSGDSQNSRKFGNSPNKPYQSHASNQFHATKLTTTEMQTGMIALLDQLVHEEVGNDADIVHHARELRRLLSLRAKKDLPSVAKRGLDEQRPEKEKPTTIPPYIDRKLNLSKALPTLPPISEPYLEEAVFTHSSLDASYHKAQNILDYERLEFLGDAYIELIISRLVYSRFSHLGVAQQSQLREHFVKNETLVKFSDAYNFGDRLKYSGAQGSTKTWMKVRADIFEAYVAAIVLSDPEHGYETAETWLTELWAPLLLDYKEKPLEDPHARDEINRLLMAKNIKIDYRMERNMKVLDGVQQYCIGLYFTGWGFEDEWLGSGVGQNKAQACIYAAMDALQNRMSIIEKANKKKIELYPPKSQEEKEELKKKKKKERNEKKLEFLNKGSLEI